MPYTHLIRAEELQALQAQGHACMVFDCSFDLGDPALADRLFAQQRIATAVQAHLERDLSAHPPAPAVTGGRHGLPRREDFAAWLTRVGFRNDMQAVVYDRNGSNHCGRLWWMLKWAGHEAVAVLDGGLQAWLAAGGATENGPAPSTPSDAATHGGAFTLRPPLRQLRLIDDVQAHLGEPRQVLIDSRAAPRYRGEVEPLDPIAGHIPGAINRPFSDNFIDGRFKPAAQLRAEWQALLERLGPQEAERELTVYCGSGVSAIPNMLALELAGYPSPALYAGSWSEWSRTPGLPVERG